MDRLARECTTFCRHLLGRRPSAYVLAKYQEFHRLPAARAVRPARAVDRALLAAPPGAGGGVPVKRVVVVGSGASGVHFALTALKKGHEVLMLDVGHRGHDAVNPQDDFAALRRTLPDPARYLLGEQFESVLFPG